MTTDLPRTVVAEDSVVAQGIAVACATAEGYRVKTVKSVRLNRPGDTPGGRLPEYIVRLAVEPKGGTL